MIRAIMKSIGAVLIGILLAVGIGELVVLGIVAPIFTRFLDPGLTSTAFPEVIVVFAAGFAFYFGGMLASYKAPSRRRLHGVIVGVASFLVSPLLNLSASAVTSGGIDPFANLRTLGSLVFTVLLFVVILIASYVGAVRGEALYAHNQAYLRRRRQRKQG